MKELDLCLPLMLTNREMSPAFVMDAVRSMQATGVVDSFHPTDQMVSWIPRSLWKPEYAPVASVMGDPDSYPDGFVTAAWACAATEELGIAMSTDAIRRGPAELVQTMLTLAQSRPSKRTVLMLGAGELKQIKPFGYRRAEGLDRMEDVLAAWRLLLDSPEPVDFDGHYWHLEQADIGAMGRNARPEIWSLGGGPRLIEIAARHADGIVSATPGAFPYPEDFAAMVTRVKEEVERAGRDPEAFSFGLYSGSLIHEDGDVIEAAWRNPLVLFQAATLGRLHPDDWRKEDVERAVDWHYALKMLPTRITESDALEIAGRVSPKQMERSFVYGSPHDVADHLYDFVEAGADFLMVFDLLPLVLPMDEGLLPISRSVETCRLLKQRAGVQP